jgi:aminoglycoside 3-N-acetyltransferase
MEMPLYKTADGVIYPSEVGIALQKAGVENGDCILLHSDVGVFGKTATLDREYFLGAICREIRQAVGETGTVIMPAFSYSFCDRKIFDIEESPSTVGILTEFFRKQPGVVRTKHPIFSAAVCGARQEYFLDIGKDAFGNDSFFGKLRQVQGKLVFFGVGLAACTYLHHIEQMYGINYRYMKTFTGQVRSGNHLYDDVATFFVRDLERIVELDVTRLETYLLENGIMRVIRLGMGNIAVVDAQKLFAVTCELLDQDPYYLLSKRSTRL